MSLQQIEPQYVKKQEVYAVLKSAILTAEELARGFRRRFPRHNDVTQGSILFPELTALSREIKAMYGPRFPVYYPLDASYFDSEYYAWPVTVYDIDEAYCPSESDQYYVEDTHEYIKSVLQSVETEFGSEVALMERIQKVKQILQDAPRIDWEKLEQHAHETWKPPPELTRHIEAHKALGTCMGAANAYVTALCQGLKTRISENQIHKRCGELEESLRYLANGGESVYRWYVPWMELPLAYTDVQPEGDALYDEWTENTGTCTPEKYIPTVGDKEFVVQMYILVADVVSAFEAYTASASENTRKQASKIAMKAEIACVRSKLREMRAALESAYGNLGIEDTDS